MTHLRTLTSNLTIGSIAIMQLACAHALSPVAPPARVQPIAVPAQDTQTHGTIGSNVGLMVRDTATRSTLPIYQHGGEYWVAGTPGQGYELWLTSRINGRRVLATTSVDGINVVSGETAAPIGRGYVLSPHSTSTVSGWRKSEHEVAAFNFAAPQASYAAQTGRPANVGVIGVAVFPELRLPPPAVYRPAPVPVPVSPAIESRVFGDSNNSGKKDNMASERSNEKMKSEAAPAAAPSAAYDAAIAMKRSAPAAAAPQVVQGLGTQHGERVASYAPTVAFKRESNAPAELITLRYDTVENLVARGVLQWQQAYYAPKPVHTPTPFPKSSYVPDPPRFYQQ